MIRALVLVNSLLLSLALRADVGATAETLRQQALGLINRDRTAAGLRPLQLDERTSAFADDYCRRQIRHGTTGHFTVDGLAPYMRYSFAGGSDWLLENTAGWSAGYRFGERALFEMVERSHTAMMAERPPADGHRRAILDPWATHAGIGLAWDRGEFRLAQEIQRRWISWQRPLPRTGVAGSTLQASGRVPAGLTIEAIAVHHEPLPSAMEPAVASARAEYALPERRREYRPRSSDAEKPAGMAAARRGGFPVTAEGGFSFNLPLQDGPGVYTVVVWLRKGEATFAASNVSVRVDTPAAPAAGRTAR